MADFFNTMALDFVIEMSKRYAPVNVSAKRVDNISKGHIDGKLVPRALRVEIHYGVFSVDSNQKIPMEEEIANYSFNQSLHNSARKKPDFLYAGPDEFAEVDRQIAARLHVLFSSEFINELRYFQKEKYDNVVVTIEVLNSLSGNSLPSVIRRLEDTGSSSSIRLVE